MSKSHHEIKCAKCGKKYFEEDNIGSLQCFDSYFSSDNKMIYRIRADHRHYSEGKFVFSILSWENWVWRFEDNIHIEKSLFKKLSTKPDPRAIVDIVEYEKKCSDYMKQLMHNSADTHLFSEKDEECFTKQKLSDDEEFSFSSSDDIYSDEENIHSVSLDNSSVIKKVCVARFDWREKFNVLKKVNEYDCQIMLKKFQTDTKSQKYWETLEYKHDIEKQRAFKRKRLGLN